jgi:N-acetylglucosamine-6-phosphate deacetylase
VIVLSGAALVLPDRVLSPGTLVIDAGKIADIRADGPSSPAHALFAFHGHYIVPGFIDVHVHGVDGFDSLDAGDPIGAIAARLPRYGVSAFCPTTVACGPAALRGVLDQVRRARGEPQQGAARVLPAHLESNFINPDYNGAQPATCLRSPVNLAARGGGTSDADFTAGDILAEIERATPDVGIVTLAPELEGGLDLVRLLTSRGHRVSLGHSGATYDEALAAVAAGARQATHLFNRMPPLHHRALVRTAIAAKRPSRVLAITDGTAVAGLPIGSRAALGGRPIVAGPTTATLEDGTTAGSAVTMDRAFRWLVGEVGLSLLDAATVCSTTPARELGLVGHGLLQQGAVADLVVLDAQLEVVQTYVGGHLVYARNTASPGSV